MIKYTWHKGDCIIKIAEKYNVKVQDIIDINQITNSEDLYEGREIIIKED